MDNAKIQLLVILKCMSEFTPVFHVKNLVNKTTNFKNRGNPTIDLILTSRPRNFQNRKIFETGLSDFGKQTVTVLKQ